MQGRRHPPSCQTAGRLGAASLCLPRVSLDRYGEAGSHSPGSGNQRLDGSLGLLVGAGLQTAVGVNLELTGGDMLRGSSQQLLDLVDLGHTRGADIPHAGAKNPRTPIARIRRTAASSSSAVCPTQVRWARGVSRVSCTRCSSRARVFCLRARSPTHSRGWWAPAGQ